MDPSPQEHLPPNPGVQNRPGGISVWDTEIPPGLKATPRWQAFLQRPTFQEIARVRAEIIARGAGGYLHQDFLILLRPRRALSCPGLTELPFDGMTALGNMGVALASMLGSSGLFAGLEQGEGLAVPIEHGVDAGFRAYNQNIVSDVLFLPLEFKERSRAAFGHGQRHGFLAPDR